MSESVESSIAVDSNAITALTQSEIVSAISTGEGFLTYLQQIPTGRKSTHSGFTFNRVLKVFNTMGFLPVEFGEMSYGNTKANQRELLHTSMKSLSQETHGKETFEEIRRAILNIPEAMINSSENSESVTLNRWALLAEFYVHCGTASPYRRTHA
jgi:hypothetical protein